MAAVTGRHWARTLVSASVTPGTLEPGHNIPVYTHPFRVLQNFTFIELLPG